MKFYQNKKTGEIIGIENMRQLITHPTMMSEKLGYDGYSYNVVYDMICPNKILGRGIISYCISHTFLIKNYKRIRKEIAIEKYPEFKQYSYSDLLNESKQTGKDTLDIIKSQTF
ncbi:MAG: hypothetical protein ACOC33_04000 [bacterium]